MDANPTPEGRRELLAAADARKIRLFARSLVAEGRLRFTVWQPRVTPIAPAASYGGFVQRGRYEATTLANAMQTRRKGDGRERALRARSMWEEGARHGHDVTTSDVEPLVRDDDRGRFIMQS